MSVKVNIIRTDNFNRDNVSDTMVAENVGTFYAEKITEFLNEKFGGPESPNFYRVVPLDHKLYVWEP